MFKKKNNKITKYRRYSFFNIGTLLFGTVFLYMVICLFSYLTESHVTAYEVRRGTITGNYRFHALSLRTEQLVNASQSGSVRYYVREGARAAAGSAVCSVNESGSFVPLSSADFVLEEADAERLRDTLSSFSMNYSGQAFQGTYDLKSHIGTSLAGILQDAAELPASMRNACYAPESGFVLYHTDGFENVTEEQLTPKMFDRSSYNMTSLRGNGKVTAGSPLFKLITKEDWALYFPVDEKLRTELADAQTVRFRFLKDNVTFTAPFALIQNGEATFGRLSLSNSLVRYVSDRFLEIELVMNKKTGLKIPSSALVQRPFYAIPEEYVLPNAGTEKEITLKIRHYENDGSETEHYRTATVYQHKDGVYLVDKSVLPEGDYLLLENSAKSRQLQEKDLEVLYGVYNMNKGYAVFREVTIIDENEEYCIVESNNIYGLAAYDYIVLNADEVKEEQIVS